jgi:ERCC4-type nuclease
MSTTNKNQSMSLIIDAREKDNVKNDFKKNINNVTINNLSVGDIWICENSNNNLNNNNNNIIDQTILLSDCKNNYNIIPKIIIERKTWNDYVISLESKHIYEQRRRLIETGLTVAILVEGKRTKKVGYKKRDRIHVEKFLIHSQIRDKVCVFYTDDLQDTISLIKHLMNKLSDSNFLNTSNGGKNYEDCVKLDKKSGLTTNSCYLSQLSQIPGISLNYAKLISKKYKSIFILCNQIRRDKQKVMDLLSNLKYKQKNDKFKRFGKIKSERIINYLLNN